MNKPRQGRERTVEIRSLEVVGQLRERAPESGPKRKIYMKKRTMGLRSLEVEVQLRKKTRN